MGLILDSILSFVRRVPLWAWALAACLAWGGFQRHQAKSVAAVLANQQAAAAKERENALQESINETGRRLKAQEEIAHAADEAASKARADAAAADDAGRRLRARLRALEAGSCAGHSAAAGPGAAASSPADLRAYVQRRLDAAADGIAGYAGQAAGAGRACELSYEDLRKKERP